MRDYRMAVRYHHSRWEYGKIIRATQACQRYLRGRPRFETPLAFHEFKMLEMEACMQSGRTEAALRAVRDIRPQLGRGTTNWFIVSEFHCLLAMRTGRYARALEIRNEVFPRRGGAKRSAIHNERWRILEAYLHFALTGAAQKMPFNMYRFLNELPVAGRDKSGYNFSILVARIVLLIAAGRFDRLVGQEEPFKQYLYRHIGRQRHPRHFAFGHMLRKLLAGNVQPGAPNKVVERFHARLAGHRGGYARFEETEVIPYEELWRLVIRHWEGGSGGGQSSRQHMNLPGEGVSLPPV
jgi:hypothetical protein